MLDHSIITETLAPGFDVLRIENPAATARVALYGGQVLQYCPRYDGRERLFLSPRARLDGSKSIRGGIPVCWPWFGAHPGTAAGLPAHGYARNRRWQLVESRHHAAGTSLRLQLADPEGAGFGGQAELQLHLQVGAALRVELQTRNRGTQPFPLSAALHSYFAVADLAGTELLGLSGDYSDKTRDWAILPTPQPYRFAAETDRIHLQACPTVLIQHAGGSTVVESEGHDSIVVWNPGASGSPAFSDLLPDDYTRFVCVETALTRGFSLPAGGEQRLVQTVR